MRSERLVLWGYASDEWSWWNRGKATKLPALLRRLVDELGVSWWNANDVLLAMHSPLKGPSRTSLVGELLDAHTQQVVLDRLAGRPLDLLLLPGPSLSMNSTLKADLAAASALLLEGRILSWGYSPKSLTVDVVQQELELVEASIRRQRIPPPTHVGILERFEAAGQALIDGFAHAHRATVIRTLRVPEAATMHPDDLEPRLRAAAAHPRSDTYGLRVDLTPWRDVWLLAQASGTTVLEAVAGVWAARWANELLTVSLTTPEHLVLFAEGMNRDVPPELATALQELV